jgi:hypothetical protein
LEGDSYWSPNPSDVNDRRGFYFQGVFMSEPRRNLANAVMLIGIFLIFVEVTFGLSNVFNSLGSRILLCGIAGKLVEMIARNLGAK